MDMGQNQNKFDKIVCIVFMCFLILPSVIWGGIKVLGRLNPSINSYFDYDIGENRKKADFPSEFNVNTFTADVEAYYNDRVPFRSLIIDMNSSMTNTVENVYKLNLRPVLVKVLYGTGKDKGDTSKQEYLPPNIINEKVIEGREDWLFYYAENSVDYYIGNNILSDEEMENYASRVKRLSELCEKNGIEFQMIIMPNKEQVYSEYMPSYKIENEYKRTQRLVDYIYETTDIEVMYIFKELYEAKKCGQLYYKNDTHWNELGAFVGVQLLYERIGVETTLLEEIDYSKKEKKGGDLISLGALNVNNYNSDIGYNVKYKNNIKYSENVKEYIDDNGKEYSINYIESNAEDDRKLVLIGDSFRTAMVPYIARDFSESVVIYRDEVGGELAAQEIIDTDILVLQLVERYDGLALSTVEYLIAVLSQNIDAAINN